MYTLDSGYLLLIHLGPISAPYMHLILNMFVSGKENKFLDDSRALGLPLNYLYRLYLPVSFIPELPCVQ